MKKDLLVSSLVCLQVQELRAKEASDCDTWKDEISKIISNCSSTDLDEGGDLFANLGSLDDLRSKDLQALPAFQGGHSHWQAQRMAAFVTFKHFNRAVWAMILVGYASQK